MISPNLNLAPDSKRESLVLGFDIAAGYYTVSLERSEVNDMVHVQTTKMMALTVDQARKLRDDLNTFFGQHEKWKRMENDGSKNEK